MRLYLVHHADALAPHVDAMRPLSSLGRQQAARVAEALKARGAKPDLIWHSGKIRAKQTAEACYRALNPLAEFSAVRGLQPDDDPDTMATVLGAETRHVLIASHMPFLPALLQRLTTGSDRGIAEFPLNGAVTLERDGDSWREIWRVSPDERS
jgi:phosphohistidine phosphatase